MRWVKRGLWLAAWGVWAWLGVGLHRELPRTFGEPLAVNPWKGTLGKDVTYVGFLGDTNRFVILRNDEKSSGSEWNSPTQVYVYNAESGSLVLKAPGPSPSNLLWNDFFSPGYSTLFAKDAPDATEPGAYRLDLESGDWHRVSQRPVASGGVHRKRPWVLLAEQRRETRKVDRVVVIDWETGRELFSRQLPANAVLEGQRAFFAGDGERVVVPLMDAGDFAQGALRSRRVEVWRVGNPPVLEKTLTDAPIGLFPSFAAERIAFAYPSGTSTVDVYDFDADRYVFSSTPRDQRPPEPARPVGGGRPPTLSPSGKRVLGGEPTTLWDADAGAVLWRAPPGALAFVEARRGAFRDSLSVLEDWSVYWKTWFPNFKYRTHAIRDIETGRLLHRAAHTTRVVQPSYSNRAGTIGVSNDGQIYRLPLPVNWSLLALCQSFLALPLILLWLGLLWRRKRRERGLADGTARFAAQTIS